MEHFCRALYYLAKIDVAIINKSLDIKNVIELDEIPLQLSINWDQTAIHYVPVGSWTMELEGAKRVDIAGKDDKLQYLLGLWLEIFYLSS